MSSLLDKLTGPEFLLLMVPLALVMFLIRKREERASSLSLSALSSAQKGWIFSGLLAPGLGAKLLDRLSLEEREALINAGQGLHGSPSRVAYPILYDFFKDTGQRPPGKEPHELCTWLNLQFGDDPEQLVNLFRKVFLAS